MTFRSIIGFAHKSQQPKLSYRFPTFETSATALCGTTGYLVITNEQMEPT